jgi:hypothetical protein
MLGVSLEPGKTAGRVNKEKGGAAYTITRSTSCGRELALVCGIYTHIFLLWSDFKLLRFSFEKSRGRFNNHWHFLFNAVIASLDLRELSMT